MLRRTVFAAVLIAGASSIAIAQTGGAGSGGSAGGTGTSPGTASSGPGLPSPGAGVPPSSAGVPGGTGAGDTTVTPNFNTGMGSAGSPATTGSSGNPATTGSIGTGSGSGTAGPSAGASDPTAPPAGAPRIMVPERR